MVSKIDVMMIGMTNAYSSSKMNDCKKLLLDHSLVKRDDSIDAK